MGVYIVVGLGYGDEGKGTTTHWLVSQHNAHTVVRTGGPQAFHRVVTARGAEHVHSQFGSGTLSGAATHLSGNMVIHPDGILNEGEALMYEHGIRNVFDLLTIHEDALVITPFHGIANRLREIARGSKRHGTVGVGVGETVLDAEICGENAIIRARDLGKPYIREKVEAVRIRKLHELDEIVSQLDGFPDDVMDRAREDIAMLRDTRITQWTTERFSQVASRIKIVDTDYFAEKILQRKGTIVFESSQGMLLDRWYGFHPYTTKVRTGPEAALSLLAECGYKDEVRCVGVLRAYATRHGAGPFVSECPTLTKELPDAYNREHRWQGSFRVGHFDVPAVRYAIDACGGAGALYGLVVTCVDRLSGLGSWNMCDAYTGPDESEFFSRNEEGFIEGIKIRHGMGDEQTRWQEKLGQLLGSCKANLATFGIPSGASPRDLGALVAILVEAFVGVPVVALSVGPTEQNKLLV